MQVIVVIALVLLVVAVLCELFIPVEENNQEDYHVWYPWRRRRYYRWRRGRPYYWNPRYYPRYYPLYYPRYADNPYGSNYFYY